jgi:pimeloyl-ACP methyl ester carboxylesterase
VKFVSRPYIWLLVLGAVVVGRAQESYPPPGKLIDVGGRRLHAYCTGSGRPTIVLEAGASSFAIDRALVQPLVARTNRVCSYDRAGYGWSDPVPASEKEQEPVTDLHALLAAAGEPSPYLLVGQSMGSRFVRLYQHRYPREVVGIVLVDGEHEDGLFNLLNGRAIAISRMSDDEFRAANPPATGPIAVPQARLQPAHLKLPSDLQPVRLWLESRLWEWVRTSATPEWIARAQQIDHTELVTLHQIDTGDMHPLQALPLVVLTRGVNASPQWATLQADLARLSTNSRHTVVQDSDHEIHLFRPEIVVDAIADVAEAARTGSALRARSN